MKDWRTTAVGLAAGLVQIAFGVYQGGMTMKQWALAASLAILGYVSGDSKKQ